MRCVTLKAPEPTEKEVQAVLMRKLNHAGFLVIRVNSGAHRGKAGNYFRAYTIPAMPPRYQSSGMPDVLALKDGRAILIEVKTGTGKLSEAQTLFQQLAEARGVTVYTVYGLRGVDALMEELKG